MTDETAQKQHLAALFRSTAESMYAHLYRGDKQSRLSPTQFSVLDILHRLGPQTQCELAANVRRSRGNMTMVVDNLERRGLVHRCGREDDRRVVQVCLTEDGATLIQRLLPGHQSRLADVFSGISGAELVQLEGLCRKLSSRIQEQRARS